MKVRIGTAVGLVLCLGVALAKPQISRLNARQVPEGVTEEMGTAARAAAASGCNAELWDHVYHKSRLHIVAGCIAVTGTIRHIKREADGDDHIQLVVDPEFSKLLNQRNKTAQGDTLIVETDGIVAEADVFPGIVNGGNLKIAERIRKTSAAPKKRP